MNTDNELNAEEAKCNKKIRCAMVSNCSLAIVPTFQLNTHTYFLRFEERSLLKCHWIFIRKRKTNDLAFVSQSCCTGFYYQYKQGYEEVEHPSQLICKPVLAPRWPTKLRSPISKCLRIIFEKVFSYTLTLKKKKAIGHWSLSQRGPRLLPTRCHEKGIPLQRVIPNACVDI